jgi:hypothetical protein
LGGGGITNNGTLTLTNSTISGNTSDGDGGGIYNSSIQEAATITFCTIFGNTAQNGGGILLEYAPNVDKFSQVVMRNSIVALNHAGTSPDISGMLTSYGHNLFQDNSGATFDLATRTQHGKDKTLSVNDLSTLFADPAGLRDNGGPTRTYALAPGSPALDQIPLDACHITVPIKNLSGTPIAQYAITTDQRGMKRPDDDESACDIGAYESP